jgi:hypothetical protein
MLPPESWGQPPCDFHGRPSGIVKLFNASDAADTTMDIENSVPYHRRSFFVIPFKFLFYQKVRS